MEKLNEIKTIVAELEILVAKAEGGNKSATTKSRVALQKLKTVAQELRIELQAKKAQA